MNELMKYFDCIGADVSEETISLQEKEVPQMLCKFYERIKSVDLPYGNIYDIDLAIEISKRAPFFPNWFVFGKDNYFSYWLCFKGNNGDGCYFTCWDHESGLDIDEPAWEDLLSFLKAMEEDSNEYEDEEDDEDEEDNDE